MIRITSGLVLALLAFVPASAAVRVAPTVAQPTPPRALSFDERVRAQEAIERVYYSHQIGATKPFEEAVPRSVLEGKVRQYLRQSAALEKLWHTPVTASMLERELDRTARGTRMPERLGELYRALGNDPFLIQECLARPTLVDRLARNFYAFDERIHATARIEAGLLHAGLQRDGVEAYASDRRRTVVNIGPKGVTTGLPDRRQDRQPPQI